MNRETTEFRFETEDREFASAIANALNKTCEPNCFHCQKPATCFGSYEDEYSPGYACDECCGHGNEDGHCDLLEIVELTNENDQLHEAVRQLNVQNVELKSELKSLKKRAAAAKSN